MQRLIILLIAILPAIASAQLPTKPLDNSSKGTPTAPPKASPPKPIKFPNPDLEKQRIALLEKVKKSRTSNDPIGAKTFTLNNGLTIMLSENHELPEVFGMMAVKAGGKNDPKDATGIAHYLEHMLFKGTKTLGTIDYEKEKVYLDNINDLYEELGKTTDDVKRLEIQKKINEESLKAGEFAIANEFDKVLAQIGSSGVNAFTTEDFTAYHNTFPATQIERWLDVYSHRFQEPVFRLFQSELETVYEEKNRSMDNTFGVLFEKFLEKFYKKHPYGQQTILGSTDHLKNPPLKKMYQYYRDHYVANNMVLVLSGDFNTNEIMPIIREKFGKLKSGEVPSFAEYAEEEFKGREFLELKLTPIRVGAIGFRAPENGHPDAAAVEVCHEILSNGQRSGILDQLAVDAKIMEAGIMPMNYNDYGCSIAFFLPKVIGQKMDKAEAMVIDGIHELRAGNFEEAVVKQITNNLLDQYHGKWETNYGRVMEMVSAFTQNQSWEEYLNYEKQLAAVNKEKVVEVAKKYFGDNYLVLWSKMGFPKKNKLTKPSFKPVVPKNEIKSDYRNYFEKIPAKSVTPNYVNFERDIKTAFVGSQITVKSVNNPYNDIFSLHIQYQVGSNTIPALQYTPSYLELIGTSSKSAKELKEAFFKTGCTVWFDSDANTTSIHLRGNDKQLKNAVGLIADFNKNMKADDKKTKKLKSDDKAEKKMNRREPSHVSSVLVSNKRYGAESAYQKEFTKKEMKALTGQQLIDAFTEAQRYEMTVTYAGKLPMGAVKDAVSQLETTNAPKKKVEPHHAKLLPITKTKIYVVHKKNAVQSQISFTANGKTLNLQTVPQVKAFNQYFGGDMSSLVFQEIREFRSLAYSAHARYKLPRYSGRDAEFVGYIGCQGDKTNDAVTEMMKLINNMPMKPEREELIKAALVEGAQADRPAFRQLAYYIDSWKKQGYGIDPNKMHLSALKDIDFEDIKTFYHANIQNKPIMITIVGNTKNFDLEALKKFGEVTMVKEKSLYVN